MNNGFKVLDYKWKNYSTLTISDNATTGKALVSFHPHSGKEHVLLPRGVVDRKLKLCHGVYGLKIKLPFTSYTVNGPIRKYESKNKELIAVKGDTIKKPLLACLHNSEYIIVIVEKNNGTREAHRVSRNSWNTILRNHVNQDPLPRIFEEVFDVLLVGEYTDEEGKIKETKKAYMIGFGETRFWVSEDLIRTGTVELINAHYYKECNLPERPAAAAAAPPNKKSRLDDSKTAPAQTEVVGCPPQAPITCWTCFYILDFLLKKYPAILNALNGQAPEQPQPQWQQGGYPEAANYQNALMNPAGPTNGCPSVQGYVLARGPQVHLQQPPPPQTQTQTQNAPAKGERNTSLMKKFLSGSQGDVYNQSDGFNSMPEDPYDQGFYQPQQPQQAPCVATIMDSTSLSNGCPSVQGYDDLTGVPYETYGGHPWKNNFAPQNSPAQEQPQQPEEHPVAANYQDASPKYGEEGFNGNQ